MYKWDIQYTPCYLRLMLCRPNIRCIWWQIQGSQSSPGKLGNPLVSLLSSSSLYVPAGQGRQVVWSITRILPCCTGSTCLLPTTIVHHAIRACSTRGHICTPKGSLLAGNTGSPFLVRHPTCQTHLTVIQASRRPCVPITLLTNKHRAILVCTLVLHIYLSQGVGERL